MNTEKIIKDSLINFNGKVAIYYDDLKGNVIKINEKEQYNAASCIKIFILIELFNQIKNRIIKWKKLNNLGFEHVKTKLYCLLGSRALNHQCTFKDVITILSSSKVFKANLSVVSIHKSLPMQPIAITLPSFPKITATVSPSQICASLKFSFN